MWPFDTSNTDKLNALTDYSNGLYGRGSGFINRSQPVQPLGIADNSNVINIAPQVAIPDVQMPQMQAKRGLIGRMFDSAKSQATANAIQSTPVLNSVQTGLSGIVGGAASAINPFDTKKSTETKQTEYNAPSKEHLGEEVGNGFFKLNKAYFNQ